MPLASNITALAARIRDKFNEIDGEMVKSATVRNIVVLPKSQYDALVAAGTTSANTLYVTTAG